MKRRTVLPSEGGRVLSSTMAIVDAPKALRQISHIVVHCSATPNGDGGFTAVDLDAMHKARGWKKLGYHYVIEVDGQCRTGREEHEIGAHVQGSNAHSIGVCMVGTDRFTELQWEALRGLMGQLLRRYPAARVCGHRDFSPDLDGDGVIEEHEWFKTCPGFDVALWLRAGMNARWDHRHLA